MAKNRIFISYSRMDKAQGQIIRNCATMLGWDSFFDDEDLPPGSEWRFQIRDALKSSALLVALITPRWATSTWTKLELEAYNEMKNENPETNRRILFVEFEKVRTYDHMIPLVGESQKIQNADQLENEAVCWLMHCASLQSPPGSREIWFSNGLGVIDTEWKDIAHAEPVKLSSPERLRLEVELYTRIKSLPRIQAIAQTVFGPAPGTIPSEARSAWYFIIEKSNRENKISFLLETIKN